MKTPVEQAIEALEYVGKVLTMHTSISTRRPTADEYEHALKDCDAALASLKSMEDEPDYLRMVIQDVLSHPGLPSSVRNRLNDAITPSEADKYVMAEQGKPHQNTYTEPKP